MNKASLHCRRHFPLIDFMKDNATVYCQSPYPPFNQARMNTSASANHLLPQQFSNWIVSLISDHADPGLIPNFSSGSLTQADDMKGLMVKQDWLRLLLMAGFTAYVLQKIYVATDKLWQRQIGSREMSLDSDKVTFPSITFCPSYAMSQNQCPSYAMSQNQCFDNETFDRNNLPRLGDMLVWAEQTININR